MAAGTARRARTLSPHSRPSRIAVLDKRSCEYRRLQQIRDGLIEHLGGAASPVQLALIERASVLTLHLEVFDKKAFAGGVGLDEKSSRVYLGYSNSLARLLRQLGIKAQAAAPQSLADYFKTDGAGAEAAD